MFLTPFSGLSEVLECWKMAGLHSVSEGVDGFLSNMQGYVWVKTRTD